jgi:hypothetical protein
LPVTLERFSIASELPTVAASITEPAPQIVFPPDGARVELGRIVSRRVAAGAQVAGWPRTVPVARQWQAARRSIARRRGDLAAGRHRLSRR